MSEKVGRQADQKPDEWQQDLNPNPMAVGRQLSVRASTWKSHFRQKVSGKVTQSGLTHSQS